MNHILLKIFPFISGSIEPVQHTQRVSAGNWTQKPVSVVPQQQQAPPPAHQRGAQQTAPSNNSAAMNSQAMANYAQQLAAAAAAQSAAAQRSYADMQQMLQFSRANAANSQAAIL